MNQPIPTRRKAICRSALHAVFTVSLLNLAAAAGAEAPQPLTPTGGPQLTFDFPEMHVGVAEYEEGPTGATVFWFPDSVKAAVDVRGGSPGTVNAAALTNAWDAKIMDVVVLSGGSWYGLSAATGAANAIKDLRAADGDPNFIAGALGAIIFDVGGRRMSRVTPDDRLGRAALEAARPNWFPLGARGAGRFAMQGVYFNLPMDPQGSAAWPHSGQGGAFRQVGPTKIGVFTVVNAMGAVVDRDGRVVRCARNDPGKACPMISEWLAEAGNTADTATPGPTPNTTITLLVTNQKLPFANLQRVAKQVHGSMSRAIQPFATHEDGDVLYAVTTEQVENPDLPPQRLAVIASELAWDAVLSSVPELPAPPAPSGRTPDPELLASYVGDYEFNEFARVAIRIEDGALVARYGGMSQIYFWEEVHALLPAGEDIFLIDLPARDVIAFQRDGGEVNGLVLNPGPWSQTARRAP